MTFVLWKDREVKRSLSILVQTSHKLSCRMANKSVRLITAPPHIGPKPGLAAELSCVRPSDTKSKTSLQDLN